MGAAISGQFPVDALLLPPARSVARIGRSAAADCADDLVYVVGLAYLVGSGVVDGALPAVVALRHLPQLVCLCEQLKLKI